ncbi:MAG: PD40 domain-containing protein [Flavobacteriales bacterium]|nr:PD40 domain-containing protein [Flavobacteriales bacterium]MCB9193905.1 PD40 domain-containing protein [Flavobacteriales bacterium]
MLTRTAAIGLGLLSGLLVLAQDEGGDRQVRAKADALFTEERFAEAMPLYSQLVSLEPRDRDLNYRFGTCLLYSGDDKEKATSYLKFAVEDPSIASLAWYYLGRSYHLTYQFAEALDAFQHFRGTGDKKALASHPVDAFERQCRNGQLLLENLKEVTVHEKVQVAASDFFRFYDLEGIGGRIVITPDELRTSLDKKREDRSLIYLPDKPGPIYFSSFGKDGRTGKDIYRTELLPTGQFAGPERLAGFINTDQDDDYPFMAPDGKTFYFCSKGHNSMGGYDVFRSTYDKGLDVFGPPENMDFAVNTPDDDILYLVDASGQEACFASGRDSRQDMVHVYRISTQQVPVTMTVLKGTFASELDPDDRNAHIVVEDGLNREVMADVRTDMNGTYVLSLPRSGRYRFLVEAGPEKRTHAGIVEVPRSEVPRAYRQELSLVREDGQERLVIKNYFDEPLSDDLIALSLDEIKRRAKLDVNDGTPNADQGEVATTDPTTGDLMRQAGFNADLTLSDALQMAEQGATQREQQAEELGMRSGAAYTLALENASTADEAAQQAALLVQEAASTEDKATHDQRMLEAAEARQRSREANMRARAAMEVGQDLDAERSARTRSADELQKVSNDLDNAVKAGDRQGTRTALVRLAQDQKATNGPGAAPDVDERMRRAAATRSEEAAHALASANGKRAEQGELTDRISRLKSELATTKNAGKRTELQRQIDDLNEQLDYLDRETDAAFDRARILEQNAGLERSKARLVQHLTSDEAAPSSALDEAAIAALGQRISSNEERIGTITIDQRFEAQLAVREENGQRDAFDWDLAESTAPTTTDRGATGSMENGVRDAQQEDLARTSVAADIEAARPLEEQEREGTRVQRDSMAEDRSITTTSPAGSDKGTSAVPQAEVQDLTASNGPADSTSAALTPEQVRNDDPSSDQGSKKADVEADLAAAERDRFLLENRLAELEQLRAATRTSRSQDSLDTRISELRQDLAAAEDRVAEVQEQREAIALRTAKAAMAPVEQGNARTFDPTAEEEAVIADLFPGFANDEARAMQVPDKDERISDLIGLNSMLLDSIHTESQRQLALLDAHPEQANVVLPRVQRLHDMGQDRERRISEYRQEAARGVQDLASAADAVGEFGTSKQALQPTRVSDGDISTRYVTMPKDPSRTYSARPETRSAKVGEAVALWDQDLGKLDDMDHEIDSLEAVLDTLLRGKTFDRLRKHTDKLIDDRLILATEMGQRSEFIVREESKTMRDSLRTMTALVDRKGLSPTEPLLAMAKRQADDGQASIDEGARLRKMADRTEDIIARDSLFRTAYANEMTGLRQLDQAITVRNYILSEDYQRGQRLSYSEVEAKLFPSDQAGTELAVSDPTSDTGGIQPASTQGSTGTGRTTQVMTADPTAAAPSGTRLVMDDPGQDGTDWNVRTTDRTSANDPSVGPMIDQGMASALQDSANTAMVRSEELEQRSLALSDRALAMRDSAATVRKRDRDAVLATSTRIASLSDSLHQASLRSVEEARMLEQQVRDAAQLEQFKEELKKYYYLDGEEYDLVTENTDHSRYFQAKVKAMEQERAGREAEEAAGSNRKLARELLDQVEHLMTPPPGGSQQVPEEDLKRANALNDRAIALDQRADSLSAVAQRLRGAAALNDGQAALILQGLQPDKASAIMAMEQRSRREEPLLSQVRATASEDRPIRAVVPPAIGSTPEQERTAAAPDSAREAANADAAAPRTAEPHAGVEHRPFDFPMPEELREDIFSFVGEAGDRNKPIPINTAIPKGLVFKVQIGAFRNPIPQELFNDMTPVMGETTTNGLVRYTAGLFTNFATADEAKARVRDRGYRDAFVVAYRDGERISLREARGLLPQRPTEEGAPAQNSTTEQGVPERVAQERTTAPDGPTTPISAPSAIVPGAANAADADAQVLAKYPDSAERVLAEFAPTRDVTSYYNDPTAAPAKPVEVVRGLFFTVQVGVYSRPVPLDKLFNITPLNTELINGGKIRYTTGVYREMDRARARKDGAVSSGVRDAFITAYLNGKRIPMTDARALLARFGDQVLVDPGEVTP